MDSSIDRINETADFHFNLADKQRGQAAFFATALTWTIPLLAALVSAFITGQYFIGKTNLADLAVPLSLVLTLLSIIQATAKPDKVFRSSAYFASAFRSFKIRMDHDIQRVQIGASTDDEKTKQILDCLDKKNVELEQLISTFNSSFISVGGDGGRTKISRIG
ncbi:hypothetical protein [Massilia sp. HP4]|uniref:hypothetical protein n=1 Tax=Massilia sp. HP4 TaxID=2562316 RepID=UPI0010BF6D57|nr:hypothetical protein [Massilia sp. HP4]